MYKSCNENLVLRRVVFLIWLIYEKQTLFTYMTYNITGEAQEIEIILIWSLCEGLRTKYMIA